MSCNIKLAVSESSQLSVSLVVLACRAAHLCLLDKTCSTLPRDNTLSLFLFFFSFSLQCFLFYFVSSVSIIPFVCLSHFLLSSQHFTTFYLVSFYFQKIKIYFLNPSLPFPPYSLFLVALHPASLFPLPFCFSCPSSPAVRFDFVLFWDLFVSPSVYSCAASLSAVFISSPHLAEHMHEHAHTTSRRLIETCVSKLLMFTEALYCR